MSTSSAASTSTSTGTTTLSVARRQFSGYGGSYLPSINEQLATQLDPRTGNYTWQAVNVPQGWYYMLATVQGVLQSSSSSFFVENGTNTDCIPQFAPSSSPSTTSLVPVSTSASPSAVVAVTSDHSHAGAITGGVIGGIAFFAAALVAFLFWFFRRRPDRSRDAGGQRWSLRRFRHASDGRALAHKDNHDLPSLEAEQTFVGSDEEIVTTAGHEKMMSPDTPSVLPYISHSPPPRRTSTGSGRVISNPERPIRPPSYQPYTREAIPMDRPHTTGNVAIERTQSGGNVPLERPQTAGNPPRRKPAPRYDEASETAPAVEGNGSYSSYTTLDYATLESAHGHGSNINHGNGKTEGTHGLQHQSSFGAMRPMHVIMPDLPPPART